jgi:hypothetical protein
VAYANLEDTCKPLDPPLVSPGYETLIPIADHPVSRQNPPHSYHSAG